MSINLTDNQKRLVRWLVDKDQAGNLSEPFLIYGTSNGLRIAIKLEEGEKPPEITKPALIALEKAELLICSPTTKDSFQCSLTEKAYTAVANNFQETGTLITDLKDILFKLSKNLNELRDREAKFGGQAPVELLNEIDDHKKATSLIHRLIDDASELQQELGSLNIADELKARLLSIFGEK